MPQIPPIPPTLFNPAADSQQVTHPPTRPGVRQKRSHPAKRARIASGLLSVVGMAGLTGYLSTTSHGAARVQASSAASTLATTATANAASGATPATTAPATAATTATTATTTAPTSAATPAAASSAANTSSHGS